MFGVGLFGPNLGIAWPDEVLDQHVGGGVLLGIATVVRDFGIAVATRARPRVCKSLPKIPELATRFAELVLLEVVVGSLARGHVHFALVDFEVDAIACQRIQQ